MAADLLQNQVVDIIAVGLSAKGYVGLACQVCCRFDKRRDDKAGTHEAQPAPFYAEGDRFDRQHSMPPQG